MVFCVMIPTRKQCIQNVYKSLFKYEIHFVYKHFVYILYTFCVQNVYKCVEIWNTFYIQTFYIHFVYINSDLLKAYMINIMYTIYMQNSYKIYMQIIVCRMDPLFRIF